MTPAQNTPNAPMSPIGSDGLPRGVAIEVELSDLIDSGTSPAGTLIHGRVTRDVLGPNSKVAIPGTSNCVIAILESGKAAGTSFARLALYQVTIADQSYLFLRGDKQLATLEFSQSAAAGEGHRSVHIQKGARLTFALSEPLSLKR